jgi:putative ABC transport system substrate-binding protein
MIAIDYDPVATGHISGLARPGGRITGVSVQQTELAAKRLELLKELLPKAKRIAVFSDVSTAGQLKAVQAAAKRLGVALQIVEFRRTPYDYEGAFAESVRAKAEALLVLTSGNFVPARRQIPESAMRHRLPSMYGNAVWVDAGGLLSYAPNFSEFYRRAADQVSLILKGAKPAEMPVEQPTTFELVINLKTAKVLGITIVQSLRARADRLIDLD